MSTNRGWSVALVAASLMSCGGTAMAQHNHTSSSGVGGYATPSSRVGGHAGAEMSGIYQQGIGINYSASSIVANDLRRSQAIVPYVGQSVRTGAGFDLGLSPQSGSKPFSHVTSTPTVSPWMNMFREDLSDSGDFNYQTLVRPQLDQERFNRQVERQNIELGQRVQAMSAQNAYSPEGSKTMYPTGHPTVFMNYGHFYPAASRKRGR